MPLFSIKASIFLILALFFSGCATHDAKGRLYDLQDGSVINVKLNNYFYGHGTATAVLQTGEQLKGEFTLSQLTGTHKNKTHTLISPFQGEISVSGSASKSIPQKETPGFSQVYGFSEKSEAIPVGTGTLVGNQGTILQMVLYSSDTVRLIGDGVARSSKGEWYRVHIGHNKEQSR